MGRRDWMVVLLPSLTLVVLFLISTSMPQYWLWQPSSLPWCWNHQQRHSKLWTWQATTSTALALLGHQEAQLLAQLNSTADDEHISHAEFVQNQLTVNEQLQQILTTPSYGDAAASMQVATSPACRKTGGSVEDPTAFTRAAGIPWQPSVGRYLVMICNSGQVTNHLICLHKHMYFGALLNRTLVLPHASLDYKYEHLLDIAHLRLCLGNSSIITFEVFEQVRGKNLHIDKLICYMHDCYFDKDHQTKWEALGFTFGTRQDAWSPSSTHEPRRRDDDILSRFVGEEQVIAVGDLFYADVVKDSDDFAVISNMCNRNAVRPHRSIMVAAQRFVQTYLGSNFVAVHFRRHGFLVFCNKHKGPSCFYPIPQAARCIERKVREARADVVYLSTDAALSEVVALVAGLERRGLMVVRRSEAHEALAKWDAVLWRKVGREAEAGVMSMVDKTICAMAVAFVGTRSSSFSAHIQSMRRAMHTASACDAPLCHGLGPPSFLADLADADPVG